MTLMSASVSAQSISTFVLQVAVANREYGAPLYSALIIGVVEFWISRISLFWSRQQLK